MKNNLYTKSYFVKRLRDNGYNVNNLVTYSENDIRKWTININPDNYNILCTCYKDNSKNFWFNFICQQNNNITLKTMSMKSVYNMVDDLIEGHKLYDEIRKNND